MRSVPCSNENCDNDLVAPALAIGVALLLCCHTCQDRCCCAWYVIGLFHVIGLLLLRPRCVGLLFASCVGIPDPPECWPEVSKFGNQGLFLLRELLLLQ